MPTVSNLRPPLESNSSTPKDFLSNKLIAIEGVIGVGKTTLARMLASAWKAQTYYEVFEENPFLTHGFYEDRAAYAFNTEVFFLLNRRRQQNEIAASTGVCVTDYLFEKSAIFAKLNLSKEDFALYDRVYQPFAEQIRKPDLIVHLQADLETLLRRIYLRDRSFERSISPEYLERLSSEYYRYFSAYTKAPVLQISTTGLDFQNDSRDFNRLKNCIEDRLLGQVQLKLQTMERPTQAHVG